MDGNSNNHSLMKYDAPLPLSGESLRTHHMNLIMKAFSESEEALQMRSPKSMGSPRELDSPRKRRGRNSPRVHQSGDKFLDMRAAIDAILPPKQVIQDGGKDSYMKFVSITGSTREEVVKLEQEFEKQLELRQARNSGICPVKEELVSECFDELLRQVALDCPERGLLLVRVRDELRMTLAAYRTVYESSICFSARKAAESMDSIKELEEQAQLLEKEVEALKIEKLEWKNRVKKQQEFVQQEKTERKAKNQKEIRAIEAQIQSFQTFLDQENI